jgi:hypothetical protein
MSLAGNPPRRPLRAHPMVNTILLTRLQEDNAMTQSAIPPDEASAKGAVEDDRTTSQTSLSGQLGHRDQDEELKDNDTDFPEPDAQAEITGK